MGDVDSPGGKETWRLAGRSGALLTLGLPGEIGPHNNSSAQPLTRNTAAVSQHTTQILLREVARELSPSSLRVILTRLQLIITQHPLVGR